MGQQDDGIGRTIRELRRQQKLTQQELADRLGVNHAQVISSIEKGERALKATELIKLAELLSVSPSALLAGSLPPAVQVAWRTIGSEDVRSREEARFLNRCRRYAFVEQINGVPHGRIPLAFELDTRRSSFEEVGVWANATRSVLAMGSIPALVLREVLENRWGVKILFDHLEGGSAATARADFGDAILINASEVPWRRRYSLAHELFHLLTWERTRDVLLQRGGETKGRVEQLADVFASCVLLPEETVRHRFVPLGEGPRMWFSFFVMARELGVSTEALLWRLANLELIPSEIPQRYKTESRLSVLDKSLGRAREPEEPKLPARYVHMAFRAYLEGKISIGKLAELMETTVGLLPRELAVYDLDMDSDAYETTAIPA
jgi:Zn-dependent peptidase ImmA (M78 family)/transcriptional regulator with XRE-family HTH domain